MDSFDAGKLLRDARCMAGLTQAEVAQRAGVSQQTVALYERGRRDPSVPTLARLVAGCGLHLRWNLVPEPGLEDEPTRALLARDPLDRLEPEFSDALVRIAGANRGLDVVFGGKLAARIHGADVRVHEIDLWTDPLVELDALNAFLACADIAHVSLLGGPVSPALATRELLLDGWPLAAPDADVYLRSAEHFTGLVRRSVAIPLPGEALSILVASPDDCIRWWHERDLDRLALQRAVRLNTQSDVSGGRT